MPISAGGFAALHPKDRSDRGLPRKLLRRWVVERSFAWAARFRRRACDYERLATTFAGYHWLAFVTLMLGTFSQGDTTLVKGNIQFRKSRRFDPVS